MQLWREELGKRQKEILKIIKSHGIIRHSRLIELCEEAKIASKATVEKDLERLAFEGYITYEGGGRKGAPKFYKLTDMGERALSAEELGSFTLKLLVSENALSEIGRCAELSKSEVASFLSSIAGTPALREDFSRLFIHLTALYIRLLKELEKGGLVFVQDVFGKTFYGLMALPPSDREKLEKIVKKYGIDPESVLTSIFTAIRQVIGAIEEGLEDGTFESECGTVSWILLSKSGNKIVSEFPHWSTLWELATQMLLKIEPEKFKQDLKKLCDSILKQ